LDKFKSLYFVRADKSVYIVSMGTISALERRELDSNFGFSIKKRLPLKKFKKDRIIKLQSVLQPGETYTFRRLTPISPRYSSSHSYLQKKTNFRSITWDFKDLRAG